MCECIYIRWIFQFFISLTYMFYVHAYEVIYAWRINKNWNRTKRARDKLCTLDLKYYYYFYSKMMRWFRSFLAPYKYAFFCSYVSLIKIIIANKNKPSNFRCFCCRRRFRRSLCSSHREFANISEISMHFCICVVFYKKIIERNKL
jgi:hypothetical protein